MLMQLVSLLRPFHFRALARFECCAQASLITAPQKGKAAKSGSNLIRDKLIDRGGGAYVVLIYSAAMHIRLGM